MGLPVLCKDLDANRLLMRYGFEFLVISISRSGNRSLN